MKNIFHLYEDNLKSLLRIENELLEHNNLIYQQFHLMEDLLLSFQLLYKLISQFLMISFANQMLLHGHQIVERQYMHFEVLKKIR